jgi:hypothetical protein
MGSSLLVENGSSGSDSLPGVKGRAVGLMEFRLEIWGEPWDEAANFCDRQVGPLTQNVPDIMKSKLDHIINILEGPCPIKRIRPTSNKTREKNAILPKCDGIHNDIRPYKVSLLRHIIFVFMAG